MVSVVLGKCLTFLLIARLSQVLAIPNASRSIVALKFARRSWCLFLGL